MHILCSICLESVKRPAILRLNCECKYSVHYSCYMTWWRDNKNCIICHESSNRPKYNKKYKKKHNFTPRKNKLKIRNRIHNPRHNIIHHHQHDMIYHPQHDIINFERENIYNQYFNRLPFDNENELKTIFVSFILIFISCYFLGRFQNLY